LLGYFSETETYNFSLVTRIMEIDGENYFVTTINLAPKDDKKFAPFADIIEIMVFHQSTTQSPFR